MPAAPLPSFEKERLSALAELNIADSDFDAGFDIFPLLASKVLETSFAAVTLVDFDVLRFKAGVGIREPSMPRAHSICPYAILNPSEVLTIPDAATDPRVFDYPAVIAKEIGSYAGVPISGPSGLPLGALCVVDKVARQFSAESLVQLGYLAVGTEGAIKLHAAAEERRRSSMTDPLTGVGNRLSFEKRLDELLAACGRDSQRRVALLSIDLDEFRSINDLFGHNGGDLALQEAAKRLKTALRGTDSVHRIREDHFCVVLDLSGAHASAEVVAHRFQAAFAARFCIEQHLVPLRASVGVALFPGDAACAATLKRRADIALYEAKCSGGGSTIFARSHPDDSGRSLGRQEMRRELYAALLPPGAEPFELTLQPVVHTASGALTGFEALVRWPRPDGSMMPPGDFIPVAEATGLVVNLDRWVIDRACRKAVSLPSHLTISCNVSAANFLSGHLVEDVCKALGRHRVEPHRLKLEITETILLRDAKRVRSIMIELRGLGIDVILDDFGIGNASIAYLRDYPFNGLKIDRSFVTDLEIDSRHRIFVKAILDMASALNVAVTAEGVETAGQLRILQRNKVDLVQGYLLGRPMREAAIDEYVYQREPPQGFGGQQLRSNEEAGGRLTRYRA